MARHGTPSAPRKVGTAFICVILAGVPAPIGDPRPVTHPDSSGSVKSAKLQAESRNVLSPTFGLARLQQKTRSRNQEKVGSAF